MAASPRSTSRVRSVEPAGGRLLPMAPPTPGTDPSDRDVTGPASIRTTARSHHRRTIPWLALSAVVACGDGQLEYQCIDLICPREPRVESAATDGTWQPLASDDPELVLWHSVVPEEPDVSSVAIVNGYCPSQVFVGTAEVPGLVEAACTNFVDLDNATDCGFYCSAFDCDAWIATSSHFFVLDFALEDEEVTVTYTDAAERLLRATVQLSYCPGG